MKINPISQGLHKRNGVKLLFPASILRNDRTKSLREPTALLITFFLFPERNQQNTAQHQGST